LASLGTARLQRDRLPLLIAAATVVTVAVGLTAKHLGVDWGAPAQPLVLIYRPAISGWAVLGVAVLAAALIASWRLLRSGVGTAWFGLALFALTLTTRLALNMVRGGPHAWYADFIVRGAGEGHSEYLPALGHLRHGVGPFLEHFVSLIPTLPDHAAGHPPGLLLTLHVLGIETPQGVAALTILIGALATPALYLLGRELFDESTARVAALLLVFVPTSLLYGATSADALYATLGVLAAACLLSRRRALVVAGAIVLTVASFFSYALVAVGAWAVIVIWRRDGMRPALRLAVLCAACLVAFYLALDLISGFDVIAALRATDARYREGIARIRPYFFYLFGSPAAFIVMLGPVAWFAARSLARREATALALAAVIVVSVLAGYTKAETERIWLFLVPFACLAAARSLRSERLPAMLGFLTAQALVIEVLLFTKW
jgi:hypothetical protein